EIAERTQGKPLSKRPRVAMGAATPMARPFTPIISIHGADGLGDLAQYSNEDGSPRYMRPKVLPDPAIAVDVILEAAERYGSELSIVTIGPLTNLAYACQRNVAVLGNVKQIVVMGGAVTVPGNVMPLSEFNIHCDPEAAAVVFDSGLPLTLVPLDATHQAILTSEVLEREVKARPSVQSQFVWDCTRLYADFYRKADQMDGF
ncbi:MAG TPA: nucleoside hydrolase, partial [Opitutales bacterium]|nr:nucleoside hydrolase [Opitutales bacterium]